MEDKIKGSLYGLIIGDALGAPFEFKLKGTFTFDGEYHNGGHLDLNKGEWTDDSSLMLCILASLNEYNKFSPKDIMKKFSKWHLDGYLSSKDKSFDISSTTKESIETFLKTKKPYVDPQDENHSDNGSIMRLAPIPIFFYPDLKKMKKYSMLSSAITNNTSFCLEGCKIMATLFYRILNGLPKESLFDFDLSNYSDKYKQLKHIKKTKMYQLKHGGFVYDTLESALWSFYKSENFRDGMLIAINLGGDTDTRAAVYGQIAGLYYGFEKIPEHYVKNIAKKDMVDDHINKFINMINVKKNHVPNIDIV
jgi:ADP-ribosyl-[dinitrogen reductase] hydrolase